MRVYQGGGRYRHVGTYDTEAEALIAEQRAKLRPTKQMPTVAEWGDIWLSDYPRPAPATQRTYRYAVETVKRELGSRRMDDVERPEARRIANKVPANTVYVARTMWADAVRDGVCDLNPWTGLRLRGTRGRKDIDVLTAEEIQRLANLARGAHGQYGQEASAIVLTLAYTTMRPAELCALRWSDIDLENDEIVISRSLDALGNEKCRKKERAARIALSPQVRTALGAIPRYVGDGRIFHSIQGKPLNKSNLHYLWRAVRDRWIGAGGRDIDLYELRHAGITLLLEAGLDPATVAVQAGHSDGGRTIMRVYGHPSEERARERIRNAYGSMAQPSERPAEHREAV